jgi:short-subunit dehydrogenase
LTRRVWITGASSGIGRALALLLAREGDMVAVSARSEAALASLAGEAAAGGRIKIFPVDVADTDAMKRQARAIEESIGPLDLAIFNAGTHEPVEPATFDAAPFRRLMEINLMGTVNGLAAVLPNFVARRHGHVAVVSSVAGYRGLPQAAAYGASKAALINLAESLKLDLERNGVKISLINPGFVRTPLTDRNPFPMPFLMEVDDAARRIARGLERGGFEITFPRRFTWMVKFARILPYALYFRLIRLTTGR